MIVVVVMVAVAGAVLGSVIAVVVFFENRLVRQRSASEAVKELDARNGGVARRRW